MQTIEQIIGSGVPLLIDDVDTDRIIPARYLRCVTFDGLGEHAFEDDRKQDENHPFDDPRYQHGTILITGRNFGCGSSREHAPQSLMRWGIRAVVAESLAEIFFGNCTSLGLPAVTVDRSHLEKLSIAVTEDPDKPIAVDLMSKTVVFDDRSVTCEIPESACKALTSGRWDFLEQLLATQDRIHETADRLPYLAKDFA